MSSEGRVLEHRLSALLEALWMDAPTAAALIQAGVDPQEFQKAVRERLTLMAEEARDA